MADSHADAAFGEFELTRLTRMSAAAAAAAAPSSPAVAALAGGPPSGPLSIRLLPGEPTLARRIRFALVNACTVASLLLALFAIFLVVVGVDVRLAALCVLAGVVFDGADGALARRFGVSSPFGAQMDSLVDMCSFGVATPVVVYAWLAGSVPLGYVLPACALVAVCAAIRLARFNVSPKDGRFFCGVPTTMAAAVLSLSIIFNPVLPPAVRVVGVTVFALAMVSSFPYAKLARVLRLPSWMLVLPAFAAMIDYRLAFVGVVLAYLCSGPVLWLFQRRVDETA